MTRLEDIVTGAKVLGIDPKGAVEVASVTWYGTDSLEIVYRNAEGRPHDRMLYRHDESLLEVAEAHRQWGFDADPALTRLAAEAQRIRLAYNFDPHLAIHSSDVDPLPHQITAVYEEMLTRQPMSFLLADDPGAGKTIMTRLFIRELIVRDSGYRAAQAICTALTFHALKPETLRGARRRGDRPRQPP